MRAALAFALALAAGGCAHYTGEARPIAPERVEVEQGWVTAAPTPTINQRNLTDCGAAALAMVAQRWRRPITLEGALKDLPAPGRHGLRLSDLRAAARTEGLVAFAVAGDRQTLEHELGERRPVIVGLLRPLSTRTASSHFEVVVAMHPPEPDKPGDGGRVVTIDPGSGWQVRPWRAFDAEWKLAGRPALVVIGTAE